MSLSAQCPANLAEFVLRRALNCPRSGVGLFAKRLLVCSADSSSPFKSGRPRPRALSWICASELSTKMCVVHTSSELFSEWLGRNAMYPCHVEPVASNVTRKQAHELSLVSIKPSDRLLSAGVGGFWLGYAFKYQCAPVTYGRSSVE